MTEIEAALGRTQLKKLDFLNKKREENAKILTESLGKIGWLQTPVLIKNIKHSWHQYTIKVPKNRDKLLKHLNDSGIGARVYYPRPVNIQPCYKCSKKCPISELVAEKVISLPVHPQLTIDDLNTIINKIQSFSI